MSNELATTQERQLALAKATIFPDSTDEEFALFKYDCERQGVNPLDRLVHPQIRKFKKPDGSWGRRYVSITSIDLMRTRAMDTGECVGISDPVFSGEPGKPGFSASVTVKRVVGKYVAEFTGTARWEEYCPESGKDAMWQRMKHGQLGKCAEAIAIRKGFPKQLNKMYAAAELDRHEEAEYAELQPAAVSPALAMPSVKPATSTPPDSAETEPPIEHAPGVEYLDQIEKVIDVPPAGKRKEMYFGIYTKAHGKRPLGTFDTGLAAKARTAIGGAPIEVVYSQEGEKISPIRIGPEEAAAT